MWLLDLHEERTGPDERARDAREINACRWRLLLLVELVQRALELLAVLGDDLLDLSAHMLLQQVVLALVLRCGLEPDNQIQRVRHRFER